MKKYTDTELLSIWEQKKAHKVTMRAWAKELDLSRKQLDHWLQDARDRLKSTPKEPADKEQVKQICNGNNLEIESNSARITTLEGLIKTCRIDTEKWIIERHVINKWEVGAKDLDGNIVIEPLYQVKAWLKPRKLEQTELAIQPIKITSKFNYVPRENLGNGYKTELVLPDIQCGFKRNLNTGALEPFHDRYALDIACQIVHDLKPDGITLLGDMLDLPEWTDKFIRSPEFYWTTQPAIIELSWWLAQMILYEENASANIKALEGNHDARMRDTLSVHLSTAYQLSSKVNTPPALSVPNLLDFPSMNIKWIDGYPDNAVWLNDDLKLIHGNIASGEPGLTAKQVVTKSNVSVVLGHIHRAEQATRTIYTQSGVKRITALSPGCLCRIDGVVPGHTKSMNWQQGIAVIYYNENYHSIQSIPIDNGQAVFNGNLYVGLDRTEQIIEDTKYRF